MRGTHTLVECTVLSRMYIRKMNFNAEHILKTLSQQENTCSDTQTGNRCDSFPKIRQRKIPSSDERLLSVFTIVGDTCTFVVLMGCQSMGLWAVGTVRCCGKGSEYFPLFFIPLLLLSFFLSQDDVNEAADERERESNPGQDVSVAEAYAGNIIWTHHSVDDRPAHHKQT